MITKPPGPIPTTRYVPNYMITTVIDGRIVISARSVPPGGVTLEEEVGVAGWGTLG